ncbi:MAG: radical SAM protein, partial [Spirochaetaceae bacterium]|nr:radical SAM protein [Spirochaetaceae bacterium]
MRYVVLRKTSTVDYPGRISAVLFFPGCNLRCPWCYNRELVLGGADADGSGGFKANALKSDSDDAGGDGGFKMNAPKSDSADNGFKANADYITIDEALSRIEKRRNVLGGVVLSGGEPTLFPNLGELIVRIKSIGLKVKLDTNGMLPGILEKLFADS